jgi:hypothetical protein
MFSPFDKSYFCLLRHQYIKAGVSKAFQPTFHPLTLFGFLRKDLDSLLDLPVQSMDSFVNLI